MTKVTASKERLKVIYECLFSELGTRFDGRRLGLFTSDVPNSRYDSYKDTKEVKLVDCYAYSGLQIRVCNKT